MTHHRGTLVPREQMTESARKLRDTYAMVPGIPLFRREFGYYCLERWYEEGLDPNADLAAEFDYDPPGHFSFGGLGWTTPAFVPEFEDRVVEDRGEYELVQDRAGRHVLFFKGRRSGFMPEYKAHPVTDRRSWEERCKWRLDPSTPERYAGLAELMAAAESAEAQGLFIEQRVAGAGMYLRSLFGPEGFLLAFYDHPELVHECMETWLALADAVTARHQEHVTFDEVFIAEDICYNKGCLVSPDTMHEFFFPYYQQLLSNVRSRRRDRRRHLYVQIDTDGDCRPVIPLYMEAIGMDAMSPFEVASGCDVVEIGRKYPNLAMFGGIDKRVLALGPEAIDDHLEYILPAMRARGGYIPTSDHGVPAEVSLENYRYYRRRAVELGG
jgi:uroporphyrinogen decarboxylase